MNIYKETNETVLNKCEVANYHYFCGFFADATSKTLFFAFSLSLNVINTLLFYGIIWYERFGTGNKRTLLNKIVSLICWNAIVSIIGTFIDDLLTFFFGPLCNQVCLFFQMFRNIIKTDTLLFFDALVISKYVLIFCLKNPISVNEEFWSCFIGLIVVLFSCIFNFGLLVLPQKHSLYYYACADINPEVDQHLKKNFSAQIEVALCLIIHVAIIIRIKVFKAKSKLTVSSNSVQDCKSPIFHLNIMEKVTIFDMAGNLVVIIWASFYVTLQMKVNTMTRVEANTYPNYLYLYSYHFAVAAVNKFILSFAYYARHAPMRKTLWSEFKEIFY